MQQTCGSAGRLGCIDIASGELLKGAVTDATQHPEDCSWQMYSTYALEDGLVKDLLKGPRRNVKTEVIASQRDVGAPAAQVN